MNEEMLVKGVMYAGAALAVICLLYEFISVNYRSWKNGRALVETARAKASVKHPEMQAVLAGRGSTYVYYITFETDSGDVLKLYMNPNAFYSIPEDASGELTWQGERFWKFVMDDGKEVRV